MISFSIKTKYCERYSFTFSLNMLKNEVKVKDCVRYLLVFADTNSSHVIHYSVNHNKRASYSFDLKQQITTHLFPAMCVRERRSELQLVDSVIHLQTLQNLNHLH